MRTPRLEHFEVIPLADGDVRIISPVRRADGRRVTFYLECAGDREGLLTDRGKTFQGLRVSAVDKKRINRLIAPGVIGPAGVIQLRLPWERIQATVLFPFARSLATLAILASSRRAAVVGVLAPSLSPVRAQTDSYSDTELVRASSVPNTKRRQPCRPFHQARST